jgi:hypothetical protein
LKWYNPGKDRVSSYTPSYVYQNRPRREYQCATEELKILHNQLMRHYTILFIMEHRLRLLTPLSSLSSLSSSTVEARAPTNDGNNSKGVVVTGDAFVALILMDLKGLSSQHHLWLSHMGINADGYCYDDIDIDNAQVTHNGNNDGNGHGNAVKKRTMIVPLSTMKRIASELVADLSLLRSIIMNDMIPMGYVNSRTYHPIYEDSSSSPRAPSSMLLPRSLSIIKEESLLWWRSSNGIMLPVSRNSLTANNILLKGLLQHRYDTTIIYSHSRLFQPTFITPTFVPGAMAAVKVERKVKMRGGNEWRYIARELLLIIATYSTLRDYLTLRYIVGPRRYYPQNRGHHNSGWAGGLYIPWNMFVLRDHEFALRLSVSSLITTHSPWLTHQLIRCARGGTTTRSSSMSLTPHKRQPINNYHGQNNNNESHSKYNYKNNSRNGANRNGNEEMYPITMLWSSTMSYNNKRLLSHFIGCGGDINDEYDFERLRRAYHQSIVITFHYQLQLNQMDNKSQQSQQAAAQQSKLKSRQASKNDDMTMTMNELREMMLQIPTTSDDQVPRLRSSTITSKYTKSTAMPVLSSQYPTGFYLLSQLAQYEPDYVFQCLLDDLLQLSYITLVSSTGTSKSKSSSSSSHTAATTEYEDRRYRCKISADDIYLLYPCDSTSPLLLRTPCGLIWPIQ